MGKIEDQDYLENMVFPLTSILEDLEYIEDLSFKIKSVENFDDTAICRQKMWSLMSSIAVNLKKIREFDSKLLEDYNATGLNGKKLREVVLKLLDLTEESKM